MELHWNQCFRIISLVILFQGVLSQNSIVTDGFTSLEAIPGVDFVGFGYDARFTVAQQGLQLPIMDFSYTKGRAYFYPTDRGNLFRVPDEIFVRTVAYTEATAYLFNSFEEYRAKTAADRGTTDEKQSSVNSTSQLCKSITQNNDTTTNCSVTASSIRDKMFSIGSDVSYVKENFAQREIYYVENEERTQLYNLFLDTRFIRHDVKTTLQSLAQLRFADNPQPFLKFLETYGTHYITSATMGGTVILSSIIDKSITSTNDNGTTTQKTATAQQALADATQLFSSQLNTQVDFSLQKATKSTTFSSSSNWNLYGGDSGVINLLDSRNSSQAIQTWKGTITENPVPVQYRLREISTLYDDTFLKGQMTQAIDFYLSLDTSDIFEKATVAPLPNNR